MYTKQSGPLLSTRFDLWCGACDNDTCTGQVNGDRPETFVFLQVPEKMSNYTLHLLVDRMCLERDYSRLEIGIQHNIKDNLDR